MAQELNYQNEQAAILIQKLERIKELWGGIPAVEEIKEMVEAASELAGSLDQAKETYVSDEFPSAEILEEITRSATCLAESLGQSTEIYQSDDFPSADSLEEIARAQASNLIPGIVIAEMLAVAGWPKLSNLGGDDL